MIQILGKSSSINVRKVLWTCTELGLDYKQIDYGSGTSNSVETAEYLQLNPNAMVPVLKDGDLVLWESNTICRYLATQYGDGGLLPVAAKWRARVEQWMDWQATELNNAWRYAFMAVVRQHPDYLDAHSIARSTSQWNKMMQLLDQQLQKTGAFVAGEQFSLADVVIGLSLNRWNMTPIEKPGFSQIHAYEERLMQRVGYQLFGANGIA